MSAHPPPVPPAGRSDKGPGGPAAADDKAGLHPSKAPNTTGEQGQQGNTKQNTTHPGVVGDR